MNKKQVLGLQFTARILNYYVNNFHLTIAQNWKHNGHSLTVTYDNTNKNDLFDAIETYRECCQIRHILLQTFYDA